MHNITECKSTLFNPSLLFYLCPVRVCEEEAPQEGSDRGLQETEEHSRQMPVPEQLLGSESRQTLLRQHGKIRGRVQQ